MPFIYATAVTLNGFLADPQHSLDWLFAVPNDQNAAPTPQHTALVMGAHTYEWLLQHEELLAQPHKWAGFFGEKPVFVFSTRPLPTPHGANVRVLRGPVAEHLPTIAEAAAGGTVWIQGGGDLAGQFLARHAQHKPNDDAPQFMDAPQLRQQFARHHRHHKARRKMLHKAA